jgi:recombination protein U
MSNLGKAFEQDIIKSIPENTYKLRLKDGGGWSNATNTRFTIKNPCDFVLYNMDTKQLFTLELKHTNSKSLPFNNIKEHQIDGLTESSKYNVVSGLVIKTCDGCWFLDIKDFNDFYMTTGRKSIPYELLNEKGIPIPFQKIRKNYRYELDEFLEVIR